MVAAAFVSGAALPVRSARIASVSYHQAPVMRAEKRQPARIAFPAAMASALTTAMPAFASEGTGEALGIDNALLVVPLVLVPAVFFILFLQFDRQQDKSDFMGAFDDRRN